MRLLAKSACRVSKAAILIFMRLSVFLVGLTAFASAAPFIGIKDQSPKLDLFQQTPFCKTYGCVFRARVVDNATLNVVKTDFGLSKLNDAAVQLEALDGEVIGLEMNFPLRKSLSQTDLAAMAAMVKLAAGREVQFDYARQCQNNEPGKPVDAGKIKGFVFRVNCYRFPGVVDGSWEYNVKAWLPG